MGVGDSLMAAGECRRLRESSGCGPVVVTDRFNRPVWQSIWAVCPDVARPGASGPTIRNAPRCRPYIDQRASDRARWVFLPYRPTPARLVLPAALLAAAKRWRGAVVVEPHVKADASPNKQWGWERWQALVAAAPELRWVQPGPLGVRRLQGVEPAETRSFEEAAALLSAAAAAVLPEGGLHHAAAAVGCPAVVLYGGYIGPDVTGYDGQRAIAVDDPQARGWRAPHEACAKAWNRIRPDRVLEELRSLL